MRAHAAYHHCRDDWPEKRRSPTGRWEKFRRSFEFFGGGSASSVTPPDAAASFRDDHGTAVPHLDVRGDFHGEDDEDEKLSPARSLGADLAVNARAANTAEEVVSRTNGGAHGVLVTAVSVPAFGQALRMV
jgi:hypothetical protein